MDVRQLIEETLLEMEGDLERSLDGLTPEELAWCPNKDANANGFSFWHLSRAEDVWVSGFALQQPNVFERDDWAEKWNIPAQDTGFGYSREQLASFPNIPLDELWKYHRAVRQQSLDYLKTLSPRDFDYMPPAEHPRRKGYTIGRMFGHLLSEIGQHLGHIRYLRGLQRGIDQ